jgi:hypothetical protein
VLESGSGVVRDPNAVSGAVSSTFAAFGAAGMSKCHRTSTGFAAGATEATALSPRPISSAAGDSPAAVWTLAVTAAPTSASFQSRSSASGRSTSRLAMSQTAPMRRVLWTR